MCSRLTWKASDHCIEPAGRDCIVVEWKEKDNQLVVASRPFKQASLAEILRQEKRDSRQKIPLPSLSISHPA
jgi:hypothetical protein